MPIKHIVLLHFKPALSKTAIEYVMRSTSDLAKVIPQILSCSWGENNSPENLNRGYSHAFVMEFNNELDRQIYLEHPEHVRVATEIIIPALATDANSPIVFDYSYDLE